jgi:hypothetical protein
MRRDFGKWFKDEPAPVHLRVWQCEPRARDATVGRGSPGPRRLASPTFQAAFEPGGRCEDALSPGADASATEVDQVDVERAHGVDSSFSPTCLAFDRLAQAQKSDKCQRTATRE